MVKKTEQNDVLADFTRRLDKIGVEYMLVGSMALVHYAMPRSTVDIDIVVNILPEKIEEFIREFEADHYIPVERARESVRRRGMFNVLNQESILKIDCVVLKQNEFDQNAFARRRKVRYTDDFEVWIIDRDDLILSKLNWAKNTNSERQLLDVASIIRNGYDRDYVETWAAKLGVENLLRKSIEMLGENYVERYDS